MLTAYRAAIPGTALICCIVAFALAMCCLLAGTNPSTLPNMELYTFNTSRIGATLQKDLGLPPPDPSFNFSTMLPRDITDKINDAEKSIDSKGSDLAGDAKSAIADPATAIKNLESNITATVNDGKQQLEAAASAVESAAKNATSKIVSTFINETITALSIQDFYLSHLLTYCEGRYETTKHGTKENITYCSNHKPNHLHNTTNSTVNNNDPFAFIEDLHLPDPVAFAMKAITLLSKIIAAIYIIGIIAIFFSLIASAMLIPAALTSTSKGGLLRWGSLMCSLGAFLSLLLSTILVHFLCNKLCGFFEEHADLGVVAVQGKNFRGCSIAATVFMGLAVALALLDVAVGGMVQRGKDGAMGAVKRRFRFGRKRHEKEYDLDESS